MSKIIIFLQVLATACKITEGLSCLKDQIDFNSNTDFATISKQSWTMQASLRSEKHDEKVPFNIPLDKSVRLEVKILLANNEDNDTSQHYERLHFEFYCICRGDTIQRNA